MKFIDSFNNKSIAKLLRQVAASYIVAGGNHFQIIAYERAADSIENLNTEIKDLWKKNKLREIYGIGPNIQAYLEELFKTGQVRHFEAIFKKLPSAMFPLLDIPGIGPKTAFKLAKELKLESDSQISVFEQLEREGKGNRIAKLEGFGEKSQQEILENLKQRKKDIGKSERMLLPYAMALASEIIDYLKKSPAVTSITPLGSLRRMKATVGDVDIAVSSPKPEMVIKRFTSYARVKKVLEKGKQKARILLDGNKQIDLMIQPPKSFGSLIQHQTGSKSHNIHLREVALKMNLSVSEHGIKFARGKKRILKQFAKEEDLYKTLKMAFIPPELREDNGEIEAAQQNLLPKLVEFKDIKGDIHLHSNFEYSSSHDAGINSMEELVEKALQLGYQYIGFADHNPSISNQTERQIAEIINKRTQKIEEIKSTYISRNICIFNLFEVDILTNGKLALSSRLTKKLDAVIASIHSSFNQDKMMMTRRILSALKNPKVKVLGHPTGRLLGAREGYQLNWDEIFNFCRLKKIALEVNAFPQRLDLPDSLIRQAVNNGVKLIINTDAHEVNQMDLMRFGVATARRGWAKKSDIINTYPAKKFAEWLKEN